jgi:hypothetical protein
MPRTRTRTVVALLIAALALVAAACGSDDDSAEGSDSSSTTTEAVELDPCAEVYVAGDAAEGPEAIDGRGEPELVGCEPDGTLEIIDEVVGTGAEVAPGDTVTVQYSGVAAATGEQFDSSWSRGQAATFPLDGVIEGWGEGLVGMKEGGRRTLVIPPELGYGNGGPAPGDSLVFTVDLVAVEAPSGSTTTAVAGG